MKQNKKGQDSPFGFGTLVTWAIIIGLGVAIVVIMVRSNTIGQAAWGKIKNFVGFV